MSPPPGRGDNRGVTLPRRSPETGRLTVDVECYAGHRAEETPRRFTLGATVIEVVEVVDRWLAPDHRYFKVRGGDAATYILRHDVTADAWEVVLFTVDKL